MSEDERKAREATLKMLPPFSSVTFDEDNYEWGFLKGQTAKKVKDGITKIELAYLRTVRWIEKAKRGKGKREVQEKRMQILRVPYQCLTCDAIEVQNKILQANDNKGKNNPR